MYCQLTICQQFQIVIFLQSNVIIVKVFTEKGLRKGQYAPRHSGEEKGVKDSWKEYTEKLMNEENEWNHRISNFVQYIHAK